LTRRARDAIRSSRACALATASEASSQNPPRRFSLSGGSGVLARDGDRSPEDAGDDDRRCCGRSVARAEHRLGELAREPTPVVDARRRARAQDAADRRAILRRKAAADPQDVDGVAVVATEDRRGLVALVAHHDRGVDLEHPRALLGHGHEDALGAHLRGDQRGHAPQRALLAGQLADLDELRLRIALERALVVVAARRAIGQVDAGRDQRDRRAVGTGHGLVRPRDEPPLAGLRLPVADLRARHGRPPHVGEELPEGLALLGRDHEVARVAADDLLAAEPGRALARVVEEQDPAAPVEHADERLGGLGEDPREGLSDDELSGLRHLVHVASARSVAPRRSGSRGAKMGFVSRK
jgi:hypothetical protein